MLSCARRFNSLNSHLFHNYSTTRQLNKNAQSLVKYTNTINLPKTKFPQRLSAAKRLEVEKQINEKHFAKLYQWQRAYLEKSEFVLHDGPPYANGDLHMGHAVNKILKDIVLRTNVINGRKVHYRPGWDCHGLPIELKAITSSESKLKPIEIRKAAVQFAATTIDKQKAEFYSWGITADWMNSENIYKTFDSDYIKNQLDIFQDLYDKKLIYRDLKPVFWSPSSQTALAEAELEYDANFKSHSLTLRLKLSKLPKSISNLSNVYALIWTTTPWSLPSNQAVCYNPDLTYNLVKLNDFDSNLYIIAAPLAKAYPNVSEIVQEFAGSELFDCEYHHPIDKEILKFLPAKHVQATKGTGLVHTAPAHGPDDYLVSLEHKIGIKCLIDEQGKYTAEAPTFLHKQDALTEGTELILNYIKDDIVDLSSIRHSYPIDWRTKKPVIIRASNQWFINTEVIKEAAVSKISSVKIYPKTSADTSRTNLVNQLKKRPYWCISRQRAWGTPIPAFYSKKTGAPIVHSKIIEHLQKLIDTSKSIDFWWTADIAELIPANVLDELDLTVADVERGHDILDIWFDSGISWSYALDEPKIADLNIEGIDQFTGWFQSSLMTSIAQRNVAPYKSLFVHGFAVDEKGLKMSKSLGNIIEPRQIIQKYGIDTLRWWIAAHATQHTSIIVSHEMLQSSAETLSKIRSTLKYLVGCLGEMGHYRNDTLEIATFDMESLSILDKHHLNALRDLDTEVTELYESYQLNRATKQIFLFITNQLSGLYLHTIKDRLYCGRAEESERLRKVLLASYLVLNKVLWPIIPFMVEECWSYFDESTPFYMQRIEIPDTWKCSDNNKKLITEVLNLKQYVNQSLQDSNSWTQSLSISCPMKSVLFLQHLHNRFLDTINDSELCDILQVQSITLVPYDNADSLSLDTRTIDEELCQRCRRFAVASHQPICTRCDQVLRNEKKEPMLIETKQ